MSMAATLLLLLLMAATRKRIPLHEVSAQRARYVCGNLPSRVGSPPEGRTPLRPAVPEAGHWSWACTYPLMGRFRDCIMTGRPRRSDDREIENAIW